MSRTRATSEETKEARPKVAPALTLSEEAKRATRMLKGKAVRVVRRHRRGELLIEFDDGTRLFVDHVTLGLELSVT